MQHLCLLMLSAVLTWQAAVAAPDCESSCPVYVMAPPPVCGDGKQFMDECRARCAGAKVITPGPCPTQQPCTCTKEYKPVCCGGKTYPNACFARCSCKKRIFPGPCPSCKCPKIRRPVCGDGVTYGNRCLARCAGAKLISPGPCCPLVCPLCTNEFKPVCADGVTYRNRCLTICLCPQPKKIVPGECPPRKGR